MNCLRCGRTVPEQVLFCPECKRHDRHRPAKVPAPETTFANAEEQARAAAGRLRRSNRRLRRWIAAMSLFSVLIVGLLGYGIVKTADHRDQLAAQITRANSLQTAMDDLQSDLVAANALTDSMKDIISRYQAITSLSPEDLS